MSIATNPMTWYSNGKTIKQHTEKFQMEEEWEKQGWEINPFTKEYQRALKVRTGQKAQVSLFDNLEG